MVIPESVTSIGYGAFYGTPWFDNQPYGLVYAGLVAYLYKGIMPTGTSIVLKDSTRGIANSCFSGCSGLTSVTIFNSVTEIGSSAFSGCTGLTSVTIPNSVTEIGEWAFSGCTGLTSVTIPNSVTEIGDYAFRECTGLTSVTIPYSVTKIGKEAFSGCTGLTSVIWNAKNCKSWNSAFYASNNIKTFEFGNEVEVIPALICAGLTGLTSVTIPNSVTEIGESAFYECTGLTSVTICNSVTEIDYGAFALCNSLADIYSKIKEPEKVTLGYFEDYYGVWYHVPTSTCVLHVPRGTVEKYRSADQWKDFTNIVDDISEDINDVNVDGVVDVGDVNAVLGNILDGGSNAAYDINNDGKVDVGDVNAVLATILAR